MAMIFKDLEEIKKHFSSKNIEIIKKDKTVLQLTFKSKSSYVKEFNMFLNVRTSTFDNSYTDVRVLLGNSSKVDKKDLETLLIENDELKGMHWAIDEENGYIFLQSLMFYDKLNLSILDKLVFSMSELIEHKLNTIIFNFDKKKLH